MLAKSLIYSIALFAVSALADEPVVAKTYQQYTQLELTEMTIMQRAKLYPWRIEMMSLGFIALTTVLFFLGSRYNDNKVKNILEPLKERVLSKQFYQVGVAQKKLYVKDDGENYTSYASGRVNIESLLVKFNLQPRQNLFLWVMESVMSFFVDAISSPSDYIDVTITLDAEAAKNYDNFIWAVVSKNNMNKYRTENYFLSLTKTTESSLLPNEYVFMNEVNEMNELLYQSKLNDLLVRSTKSFKYFAITDLSDERPESVKDIEEPMKQVMLSVQMPSSKEEIDTFIDFMSYTLEFTDFIVAKASFRAELTKRCKKTREAEIAKIKKLEEQARKEAQEEEKLAQIKANKEKISKLSIDEQKKLEKKQAERKQRRMMKSQKVRN